MYDSRSNFCIATVYVEQHYKRIQLCNDTVNWKPSIPILVIICGGLDYTALNRAAQGSSSKF